MQSKNDFIKRLRNDERFKNALDRARTPQERELVQTFVENFVSEFANVLVPMIDRVENDPEFAKQLGQALIEGSDVLNDELAVTGSNG